MDIYKALQLEALGFVMLDPKEAHDEPGYREYFMRRVFRWYSKAFSTPLHQVDDLPMVDVLRAYFEEKFEQMSDEDREAVRAILIETEEERMQREATEAAEDAETAKYVEEAKKWEEERQARIAAKKQKLLVEQEKLQPGQLVIETMGGNQARVVSPEAEMKEQAPPVAEAEPVIKMVFVDEAEFEKALEGFGTMGQPEKK